MYRQTILVRFSDVFCKPPLTKQLLRSHRSWFQQYFKHAWLGSLLESLHSMP